MKYAFAALAVVAAIAALFFHPPQSNPATPVLPQVGESDPRRATDGQRRLGSRRVGRSAFNGSAVVVVYVAGEVHRPGVYSFPVGKRGIDALARAGGALIDADLVAVNLAAPLADGDEIAVPKIGATAARRHGPVTHRSHQSKPRGRRSRSAKTPAPAVAAASIDLNAADEAQLEAIPGIGTGLAERIVAYREQNGAFSSLDELADVAGITPRLQDTLTEFVFVR